MSLAANWFDEMDDDELNMDRSDDDTLSDETEPLDQLETAIGSRTLSRLVGDTVLLTLSGSDYRQIEKRRRVQAVLQRG